MDDKGISNPRVIMNSAEHILVDKYLVHTFKYQKSQYYSRNVDFPATFFLCLSETDV